MRRKKPKLTLNVEGIVNLIYPRKGESIQALIHKIRDAADAGTPITCEQLARERFPNRPDKSARTYLSTELQPLRDIHWLYEENGFLKLDVQGAKAHIDTATKRSIDAVFTKK